MGTLGGGAQRGHGPKVTYPIAFPASCLSVAVIHWNLNASDQWMYIDAFVQLVSVSPTQFVTFVQNPGSNQVTGTAASGWR